MKKQLYCSHYGKRVKVEGGYTYPLINTELNLCKKCERKLWASLLVQHDIENWIRKQVEK
jgi:hypothetical protein